MKHKCPNHTCEYCNPKVKEREQERLLYKHPFKLKFDEIQIDEDGEEYDAIWFNLTEADMGTWIDGSTITDEMKQRMINQNKNRKRK